MKPFDMSLVQVQINREVSVFVWPNKALISAWSLKSEGEHGKDEIIDALSRKVRPRAARLRESRETRSRPKRRDGGVVYLFYFPLIQL